MNKLELKLSVLYNKFVSGRISEAEARETLKELEFDPFEIEQLMHTLQVTKREFELYY